MGTNRILRIRSPGWLGRSSRSVLVLTVFCFGPLLSAAPASSQSTLLTELPVWLSRNAKNTQAVAVGDLDGDGDLDVVFGNTGGAMSNPGINMVYENPGDTLRLAWTASITDYTLGVALGDIDGDGDLDLVCGNDGANMLYLNNGHFEYADKWTSNEELRTYTVALGDIDGDGNLDLVCGNYRAETMLYRNTGTTFSRSFVWKSAARSFTTSVALGDVDGDGDLDLVVGNGGQRNTLFENIGGTFSDVPLWSSDPARGTTSVALGDVDGDGDLDLVCGNMNQKVTLYTNEGTETVFSQVPVWYAGEPTATQSVVLGDVDGDGDLDLACGILSKPDAIYENTGGVFSASPVWLSRLELATRAVVLADISGDGALDLICGTDTDQFVTDEPNVLYENHGHFFAEAPAWSSGVPGITHQMAFGDINEDGYADLVCANENGGVALYTSDGETFVTTPEWPSGGSESTWGVALGDIDDDGDLDLVCVNHSQPNTTYENIRGVLSPGTWSPQASNSQSVALGDVSGDGRVDLVCGNFQLANKLYENMGNTFSAIPKWTAGRSDNTKDVCLGDIDDDGDLDLVSSGYSGPNLLYRNRKGSLDIFPGWLSKPTVSTSSIVLGDIDGDGDLDLVCGNFSRPNRMYENTGTTFTEEPAWESFDADETLDVVLGDIDGDGDLDLVCANDQQANVIYWNEGGTLSNSAETVPGAETRSLSVALGDVDRDGDLDLLFGGWSEANTLHLGRRNRPIEWGMLGPIHHLPNNPASMRNVVVTITGQNRYRVTFSAYDVESDPVWIVGDYQFAGNPKWRPMDFIDGGNRLGPIPTSPEGRIDSLEWDATALPFSGRDVVLRLRTAELPGRVSSIQLIPSYHHTVGQITPARPEVTASVRALAFPTITVGDTASLDLTISNTGTLDLTIGEIRLPFAEGMRVVGPIPSAIAPGESQLFTVLLEPRESVGVGGFVEIATSDPLTPVDSIPVSGDILALDVATDLLNPSPEIPLGRDVTVIVSPRPGVHVERGTVLHRPAGHPSRAFESIPLEPFEGEFEGFVAVIPDQFISETGLEYYISVENSGVFSTDPPGAPDDSLFFQAVQAPTAIASNAIPPTMDGFVEGLSIEVQVSLPQGANFVGGKLYARRGGGQTYVGTDLLAGDPLPFASIADSLVGPRGVEYWVEVQTETRTLTDPAVDPASNPHSLPVLVNNLVEPRHHAGESYRLLSIPLAMRGTIAGSVTDEFGEPDPVDWRMWVYRPGDAPGYVELPNEAEGLTAFEQGRGYWLITREDHRIDTGPDRGETAPTDRPFELTLAPGWNLIGNPFDFPVAWESFMVDTLSVTESPADSLVGPPVGWIAGQGYQFDVSTLEPFDGYWVENRNPSPLVLEIPGVEAPQADLAADGVSPDETKADRATGPEAWRLQIRASCGEARGQSGVMGVDGDASTAWDRSDRSLPPMHPGRHVAVYFPHEGWIDATGAYARDIRGEYERVDSDNAWGHAWYVDVAKSYSEGSAGDEVVLEFSAIDELPSDVEVRLVDRRLDRSFDPRDENHYAFYQGKREFVTKDEETRFVILVGSKEYVSRQIAPLIELPTKTVLHQNFPNPFNPSTIIRYELAVSGRVTLRVYDVTGALVRVLEDHDREPGIYEVGWEGDNDRGGRVASGVYFYGLSAPGFSETRKMVLLK